MAECIIVGNGNGNSEQLGIYPIGEDGRPAGDVVVPEGVTSLYRYLFDGNTVVESVKLPETLTTIPAYGFRQCTALKNINISEKITSIGNYAFQECSSLTGVITLSPSISTIADNCFQESAIEGIIINTENTLLTISTSAFKDCNKLSQISIPDTVTETKLEQYAFDGCTSLTDEAANPIMSLISALGTYAFSKCTSLVNVTPNYCNDYMFYYCTGLKTVFISSNLSDGTSGQYVFAGCTNLENITYNTESTAIKKMKTIEKYYCSDCTSLISFIVPANVTTINQYAFKNCVSMKYLYLPSTITSLTASAINTCTALETIELGQDWNLAVDFSFAPNLTIDCITAIFENLKDLTGETTKTLTLGATNILKTTEEQRATATNKNWTLA